MSTFISSIFLSCFFVANVHAFSLESYLGHHSRVDENSVHSRFAFHPLTSDNDGTRAEILTRPSQEDLRVLITDGGLHSLFLRPLKKPSLMLWHPMMSY